MPQTPAQELAHGDALLAEGRYAIALEHFASAADTSQDADERATAAAAAAEVSLIVGRPHEALVWVGRLRDDDGNPDQAALLEALARVRLGDGEKALDLLEQVREPDTGTRSYPQSSRLVLRSQALALEQRHEEAVAALTEALRLDPADPTAWEQLAALAADPEVDIAPALAVVPGDRFAETYGHLAGAPALGVDRILELLWTAGPGDSRVLVLLAYIGHALPVERALEWSGRMRAAGQEEHCPLLGLAASRERTPADRLRAAALASAAFLDPRAVPLAELAAVAMPDAELSAGIDELSVLAPPLLEPYLGIAAHGNPSRALRLAEAMRERGDEDAAVALARHAAESAGQDGARLAAAARAAGLTPALDRLTQLADSHGAGQLAATLAAAAQSDA